jgi:hypothetical protein
MHLNMASILGDICRKGGASAFIMHAVHSTWFMMLDLGITGYLGVHA